MNSVNYFHVLILIFIFNPIAIVIHELGHCAWVKIFGGTVTKINIGKGDIVFSIGKINFNRMYFFGGDFGYKNLNKPTKFKKICILLGGVLANFIIYFILFILHFYISFNSYVYLFSILNFYTAIFNLFPITLNGRNLDGKQVYQLMKYGKSTFYKEEADKSI